MYCPHSLVGPTASPPPGPTLLAAGAGGEARSWTGGCPRLWANEPAPKDTQGHGSSAVTVQGGAQHPAKSVRDLGQLPVLGTRRHPAAQSGRTVSSHFRRAPVEVAHAVPPILQIN